MQVDWVENILKNGMVKQLKDIKIKDMFILHLHNQTQLVELMSEIG